MSCEWYKAYEAELKKDVPKASYQGYLNMGCAVCKGKNKRCQNFYVLDKNNEYLEGDL